MKSFLINATGNFHYQGSEINFYSSSTTGCNSFALHNSKLYTNSLGIWQVCHHQSTFKGTDLLFLPLAGKRGIFSPHWSLICSNFSDRGTSTTTSFHQITSASRRTACLLLPMPVFCALAATLRSLHLQDSMLRVLCVTLKSSFTSIFPQERILNVNQNALKQRK